VVDREFGEPLGLDQRHLGKVRKNFPESITSDKRGSLEQNSRRQRTVAKGIKSRTSLIGSREECEANNPPDEGADPIGGVHEPDRTLGEAASGEAVREVLL
jgi:hypothetical protein